MAVENINPVEPDPAWWNLDLFLAEVVANNLRDYISNSHGYPDGYTMDSWNAKLASMATRLEEYSKKFEGEGKNEQTLTSDAQAALRELAEIFPSLWD